MILTTTPFTICFSTLLLIRSVYMARYGLLASVDQTQEQVEDQMEDEIIDYVPLLKSGEIPEYDWSPPNGELPPDDDYKMGGPLSGYLGDGQDNRESWIDQENNLESDDSPKGEMKRGFDYPRKKKTQVLCRVQRAVHHHSASGLEFFPKSYTSYSCHPVSPIQLEGSLTANQDTCYVSGNNCITIEKEQLFLKRRPNTNCWTHFIEAVAAGCKCLSRKYLN